MFTGFPKCVASTKNKNNKELLTPVIDKLNIFRIEWADFANGPSYTKIFTASGSAVLFKELVLHIEVEAIHVQRVTAEDVNKQRQKMEKRRAADSKVGVGMLRGNTE